MKTLPAYKLSTTEALKSVQASAYGLSHQQARKRLLDFGPNILPTSKPPGIVSIFFHQFKSPLIYVLLAAAIMSIFIKEWSDAGFIIAVLIVNAIIGTVQEYSAQKAASALQQMLSTNCRVLREGEAYEINARELVPGDVILLESGDRIPADVRLLSSHDLETSEAALTGESLPVIKNAEGLLTQDTSLADRNNMVFAGTLVDRGRGSGVVVATALKTELGNIAAALISGKPTQVPLILRMQRFTHLIAITVAVASVLMASVALMQGMALSNVFLLAVALAVSAIPEGLPVALTVALSIGMRRMSKRNVIIRKLVAVEALGSCTFIATDKTGTLTVNQLTVKRIVIPTGDQWDIGGEGMQPEGEIISSNKPLLARICQAAILPNEAFFGRRNNEWIHHGDAVDVAFLVMAHKAGFIRTQLLNSFAEQESIPFESEQLFSASLNTMQGISTAFVKGALEKILPMCSHMATPQGDIAINTRQLEAHARELAAQGYRVLVLAAGEVNLHGDEVFSKAHLHNLTLLALVGMIDPLRHEARRAINDCRSAGIDVAMVTGDHPLTALAIARQLDLETLESNVVNGNALKDAKNNHEMDALIKDKHVFARVEPQQKLDIIHALQRQGHFVAVSGDGANDAPALRAAHVGVAMGESGTDVARETADLIITDDNFASIVAGIEEGRVAYNNVRKVIFLLISTGAAEIVLFTLALVTGLPLPLLAVQLLWLNLVTNGIQDVALAFEPAEGHELKHPPRSPTESIFNRLMIERVLVSALVMGGSAFMLFQGLLSQSIFSEGFTLDEARNGTLLLMVMFENIHVFNSRSETLSVFQHNPLRNKILLIGTLLAQLIHIGAMYTPWIRDVLHIQPVSLQHWLQLMMLALSILLIMESHKWVRTKMRRV